MSALPPANTQQCARCGVRASDNHHRLPRSRGGPDDGFNVVALCHACHMHAHAHPAESMAAGWTVAGFFLKGRYRGPDPFYAAFYNLDAEGEAIGGDAA